MKERSKGVRENVCRDVSKAEASDVLRDFEDEGPPDKMNSSRKQKGKETYFPLEKASGKNVALLILIELISRTVR